MIGDFYSDYLGHQTFIAFDTETTGMWAPANRLVELSAVKFNLNKGEIDRFDSLINPQREIPQEVIDIHGITNLMIADAPYTIEVLKQFYDFCQPDDILIAHNAPFDISFVSLESARSELELIDNPIVGTVDIFQKFFPGMRSYSLLNLVQTLGFGVSQDHRALSDAQYVFQLFSLAAEKFSQLQSFKEFAKLHKIHRFKDLKYEETDLPDEFAQINIAVRDNKKIEIDYEQPKSRSTQKRIIQPQRIHKLGANYYIEAYCETVEADRTFRLDRIKSFKLLLL